MNSLVFFCLIGVAFADIQLLTKPTQGIITEGLTIFNKNEQVNTEDVKKYIPIFESAQFPVINRPHYNKYFAHYENFPWAGSEFPSEYYHYYGQQEYPKVYGQYPYQYTPFEYGQYYGKSYPFYQYGQFYGKNYPFYPYGQFSEFQ